MVFSRLALILIVLLLPGCSVLGQDPPEEEISWDTEIPEGEPFDARLGTWNFDGTKIAFQHTRDTLTSPFQADELWILDLKTGERKQIAPGRLLTVDWSPDGKWFVFHVPTDPEYLFKITSDGRKDVRLTGEGSPNPTLRYTGVGDWHPSGDSILFTIAAGEPRGLAVMKPDGTDAHIIIPYGVQGRWSRDGEQIIYINWDTSLPPGRREQVYVAKGDGTGQYRITNLTRDGASWPVLSPDGTQIAFVGVSRKGRPELFLMNVDGSNIRQASEGFGEVERPEWSPDGMKILFTRSIANVSNRLYLLNVETLEVEPLFPAKPK